MREKLSTRLIAMANIRRKPLRSFYIIALVSVFTIILFVGTLVSISLKNGLESLSNRLGADIIVVPAGYKADIESVLLKGEASTFYLPDDAINKLEEFDEIEKMTPQIYVATLSASCCSYPVQIIGIEMESDFLIRPWLLHNIGKELRDNEVIVGNHVVGENGEKVRFFDNELKIVGRLSQTGMGFDSTVFVNRNTAKKLAKSSERITANKLTDGDYISCIMIKVKPSVDSVKLASKISKKLAKDGIFAMFSKKFINSISSNLSLLSIYLFTLLIGVWILSVAVLILTFNAIFNERKKEMAVLRVLGASNKKLRNIVVAEAGMLSFFGASLGAIVAILVSMIVIPNLANSFNMPFLYPGISIYILIFILSFLLGSIIGPLSVIRVVKNFKKKDSYITLKENEV